MPLQQRRKKSKRVARKSAGNQSKIRPAQTSLIIAPRPRINRTQTARVRNARGDVVVTHKERFYTAAASSDPSRLLYIINAGNKSMFPWLSLIAQRFETYVFRKMTIHWETDTPTTVAGAITMAVDFDTTDLAVPTATLLDQFKGAVSCTGYRSAAMHLDKKDMHKRKTYYVKNNGPLVEPGESRSANVGTLNMQIGPGIAGRFYVSYEVELQTPQITADSAGAFLLESPRTIANYTVPPLTVTDHIDDYISQINGSSQEMYRRMGSALLGAVSDGTNWKLEPPEQAGMGFESAGPVSNSTSGKYSTTIQPTPFDAGQPITEFKEPFLNLNPGQYEMLATSRYHVTGTLGVKELRLCSEGMGLSPCPLDVDNADSEQSTIISAASSYVEDTAASAVEVTTRVVLNVNKASKFLLKFATTLSLAAGSTSFESVGLKTFVTRLEQLTSVTTQMATLLPIVSRLCRMASAVARSSSLQPVAASPGLIIAPVEYDDSCSSSVCDVEAETLGPRGRQTVASPPTAVFRRKP